MTIRYQLKDIDDVAQKVITQLTSKTVLFIGNMGVGKTTLIKALAKELGSNDIVNSPTFTIINEYKTNIDSIFHLDLYRVKTEIEALNFGIEDYLYSNKWLFIEWPNIIFDLLPNDCNTIFINEKDENNRVLNISTQKN